MLPQEGEQSPQCLCREKNAGSSSSCSMLEPPAFKTQQRSGLPFDDKVQFRAAGPGRHQSECAGGSECAARAGLLRTPPPWCGVHNAGHRRMGCFHI